MAFLRRKFRIHLQLVILGCTMVLTSCKQPDKKTDAEIQGFDKELFAGFCLKEGVYLANILLFTRCDSLEVTDCPALIIRKANKISSCLPDIFKNSGMGISSGSSWRFDPETGIMTLDITQTGIDDQTHFKADYRISKFNADTLILIRTNLLSEQKPEP